MADQTEEMDLGAMARRLADLNERVSRARKTVEESKKMIKGIDKQMPRWALPSDRQR